MVGSPWALFIMVLFPVFQGIPLDDESFASEPSRRNGLSQRVCATVVSFIRVVWPSRSYILRSLCPSPLLCQVIAFGRWSVPETVKNIGKFSLQCFSSLNHLQSRIARKLMTREKFGMLCLAKVTDMLWQLKVRFAKWT